MDTTDAILSRIDQLLEKQPNHASHTDAGEVTLAITNMFETLYGHRSPQQDLVERLRKQADSTSMNPDIRLRAFMELLHGCLRTLAVDIREGRIVNIRSEARGEVLGDFLALAREALDQQEKDVAAVLACAALEDVLKRYASNRGLDVHDKDMSSVVNALKAAGVIPGPQGALLSGFVKLRNKAFHAQWEAIDIAAVNSIIAFTEIFLVKQFSVHTAEESSVAP